MVPTHTTKRRNYPKQDNPFPLTKGEMSRSDKGEFFLFPVFAAFATNNYV